MRLEDKVERERRRVLRRRLRLLATVITLSSVVPFLLSACNPHTTFVVASESMTPTLKLGDLVLVRPVRSEAANGTIVVFKSPLGGFEAHRIVGRVAMGRDIYYLTKGDANNQTDSFLTPAENIIGSISFDIPYLGLFFLIPREIALAATVTLVGAYVVFTFRSANAPASGKDASKGKARTGVMKAFSLIGFLLPYSLSYANSSVRLIYPISCDRASVASPSIILQQGIVGNSSVYEGTSATCNLSASLPIYDFVENNVSNSDGVLSIGTHSNFTAQQYGPDSMYDILAEQNVNARSWMTPVSVYGRCGASGGSPETNTIDNNIRSQWNHLVNESHWIIFDLGRTMNVSKVMVYQGARGLLDVDCAVSDDPTSWSPGTVAFTGWDPSSRNGWNESPSFSKSGRYIRLFNMWTDASNHHMRNAFYEFDAYVQDIDYQLDLEEQWTNLNYNGSKAELCIYAGTMGSERLMVDAWYNAAWQNLISGLSPGWNNVTISSYLNSPTFTIRFRDIAEQNDTVRDSWNIDATLLHFWTYRTYDYVLKIANQGSSRMRIRLETYSQTDIGRLQNCTVYLRNGGISRQVYISGGSYLQQVGSWCDLVASGTDYIAVAVTADAAGTSLIYTYLRIEVPDSGVCIWYRITFRIT